MKKVQQEFTSIVRLLFPMYGRDLWNERRLENYKKISDSLNKH